MFREFLTTSVKVTVPKLSPFQFWMRLPETMTKPGSTKIWFGVTIFSSSAAPATTDLKVEPGS